MTPSILEVTSSFLENSSKANKSDTSTQI